MDYYLTTILQWGLVGFFAGTVYPFVCLLEGLRIFIEWLSTISGGNAAPILIACVLLIGFLTGNFSRNKEKEKEE